MKFNLLSTFIVIILMISCTPEDTKTETQSAKSGSDTLGHSDADLKSENRVSEDIKKTAMATLSAASNSNVSGTVTFNQIEENKIELTINANGLPEGELAIHLHENGDCSAADASSAGGHWNPTDMAHGKRGEGQFHKGDITNLKVGTDKIVNMNMNIEGWSIGGPDSTNILNKAVIIHAGADDFKSQPSGNAGERIACGVIEMADENRNPVNTNTEQNNNGSNNP